MGKATAKRKTTIWQQLKAVNIRDDEHLLFPTFIIVLLTIIVINTTYILNKQSAAAGRADEITNVVSRPQKVLTSERTASSTAYTISVSRVTENNTFDPAFPYPANETMLILTLTIKNTSGGPQQLTPAQQLFVRSQDGDYAPMHASSYLATQLPAATVKPGQTVSGQVSFAIPKSQGRPLLYVDLGWNNYGPAVFDVLH
ncbi:MAG TPA: DUF4352 domain-containing protein [Candidatus Saccharimonadales bacterium]|nr:DUF4352 domain-containing protein [Candidatus Saccharimonadales bacterium]